MAKYTVVSKLRKLGFKPVNIRPYGGGIVCNNWEKGKVTVQRHYSYGKLSFIVQGGMNGFQSFKIDSSGPERQEQIKKFEDAVRKASNEADTISKAKELLVTFTNKVVNNKINDETLKTLSDIIDSLYVIKNKLKADIPLSTSETQSLRQVQSLRQSNYI